MNTDGLFTIHSVSIPVKINTPIHLVPFGDVHWDSPNHAEETWREFIDYWKPRRKNAYFLGMGDYLDGYSSSERNIVYSRSLHDSTLAREERETRKRVMRFCSQINWMKGRVLGIMGGNHYPEFSDGTTGDMMLANMLGTKYLGVCTALRVTLNANSNRSSIDIFAHHGRGGGTTAGGRMNAVEKLDRVAEADIYLMGHNHARGVLPLGQRLRLSVTRAGLKLVSRQQWIGRTGSFLKGYDPDSSSYVVDTAMPPASLGWISFRLKLTRVMTGKVRETAVDIRAEQ